MLLAVDIGNTSISLGIFKDDNCLEVFRIPTDKKLSKEEYIIVLHSLCKEYDIQGCIVSSVVPELKNTFCSAVDDAFHIKSLFLDSSVDCGIRINVEVPDEVGADRLANAAAASILYQGAVIVVDFGTATTFDIINSNHDFIGGIIAPGLNSQLLALTITTSKLPSVEIVHSPAAIGKNTQNAILSGVIRGTACMVEGMIRQCEKELGQKATVVATGGFATLIANYLDTPFDFVNPELTLHGLNYLYKINNSSRSVTRQ